MADAKTEKQKVKEITDKLEEGLKELFESEKYKNYLSTMSKFHNYSFNNTLLIALQRPDASLVAGYQAWQKNFNRHVKRGEKGIRILAPPLIKLRRNERKHREKQEAADKERKHRDTVEDLKRQEFSNAAMRQWTLPFDIKELRDLMEYDDLELDTLGEQKTALFVIISDTDSTFNFVVSIMYSQLFNLLCDKADDVYNGRLPIHVRMLLDEFANIGQIPQFEKLIATIRSREISASIILQSKSQLKAIYKDNADTIEGNCDTTLFLGGKEKTTLKELAEVLGKETIDLYNTSDTRGTSQSYGLNYQKTGKDMPYLFVKS